MIIYEWRSFSYWPSIIHATYMSLGFRFELGWSWANLHWNEDDAVYSSDIDRNSKVFHENYFSWNVGSRDICWCFPPLRRPSTAECRVAGPRVVAGFRGTWKPTRRWLGFEHSKQDHGKGKIIYEGIMKRKGVDARAGSRSDSMPESVNYSWWSLIIILDCLTSTSTVETQWVPWSSIQCSQE